MKKLILLLFIPLVSFGQTKFEYYESGAVKSKENYVDGKLQGEIISYYESGALRIKANTVDDKLQGEAISYYESGAVKRKTNYVDGLQEGEEFMYYESGAIQSKHNFVNVNLSSGYIFSRREGISYYESGVIKSKSTYVDSLQLQMEVILYNKKGEIEKIGKKDLVYF